LYRTSRPQSFDDVVGQESIVKTLANSLKHRRISHAYLFTGPRGTGKTSVARILAKGLNCTAGPTPTPCGECEECRGIRDGTSLNVIEIDGASNRGIDDVRELRSQVQFAPVNASYKVYIIDEVHMLTTEAFNALLKTLEEPPAHVVFIFATTDPHRLPATILSRVQRYDFTRFSEQAMVDRLEKVAMGEQIPVHKEALHLIARHAAGGMRDALGTLEKCAAFAEEVTAEAVVEVLGVAPQEQIDAFVQYVLAGTSREALQIIDDLFNHGRDLGQFALSVIAKLRQDLLVKQKEEEPLELTAIEQLAETVREMRFAPDPRIPLELAVLKLANPKTSKAVVFGGDLGKLEEKVRTLEAHITKLNARLAKQKDTDQKPGSPGGTESPKRRLPSANDEERSTFLLDIWSDYLKGLRDERLMQCEAFLKEGAPVEVMDDNVIIAFPRERGFHKASIEQDSHREPSERVLSRLMGKQVRLKCVFQDEATSLPKQATREATPAEKPKSGQGRSSAKPEPQQEANLETKARDAAAEGFLRASMETFGGKIIEKSKEK
jgi:DNA polymerase-3 subunit gamma/tau